MKKEVEFDQVAHIIQNDGKIKKKIKTKTTINHPSQLSHINDTSQKAKLVPDIDMNTLAKKYKQLRKSGEYIGGLSSDAKYS